MKIKVVANQTLRDIAIKYYGNIEAMAEIIDNNPHLKNEIQNDVQYVLENSLRGNLSSNDFLLDSPIKEGIDIEIDRTSFLEISNITRELKNHEINTFDNGEKN